MKMWIRVGLAMVAATIAGATQAQVIAYDDASDAAYSGGNVHGLNGGFGFGAWSCNPSSNSGVAGNFQWTSSQNGNGSSGNIDTAGKSFGYYANSFNVSQMFRGFNVSMAGPRTITLDWDCGWIDQGQYSYVEIGAYRFGFTGGNANFWWEINGGGQNDSGLAFTTDGVRLKLVLNGTGGYNFSASPYSTSSVWATANFSGAFTPTYILAVNGNAGFNASNNSYINSLKIVVPEPATMAGLGFGALALLRRKRK